MATIIASGTVHVAVQNDVGNHAINGKDVEKMTEASLVFLSVRSGTPDGVNPPATSFPQGYGPLFNAAITLKGKGFFNLVVAAVKPNGWNVPDLPVDWIVVA